MYELWEKLWVEKEPFYSLLPTFAVSILKE